MGQKSQLLMLAGQEHGVEGELGLSGPRIAIEGLGSH